MNNGLVWRDRYLLSKTSMLGVDDVKIQMQTFAWPDYSVFVFMLATCAGIGIYFGFFEKKSKNVADESDYLVGGRNMKVFPVSMSLIATCVSTHKPIYSLNLLTDKITSDSYQASLCWALRPKFIFMASSISTLLAESSLWDL